MTEQTALIPIFPLNTVLLPGIALPLHIFEERYRMMIATCLAETVHFGVVLIANGEEVGAPAEGFAVGTTARIIGVDRLSDGRMNIVCVGERRFRVVERVGGLPYQRALVSYWPDEDAECDLATLARQARGALDQFLALGPGAPSDALSRLPDRPTDLANLLAASLPVDLAVRQALLEAPSVCARLQQIASLLTSETTLLRGTGAVRYVSSRPSAFSPN